MGDTLQSGTPISQRRREKSLRYPWYDSHWLEKYVEAKAILQSVAPDSLAAFIDAFRILRTSPEFRPRLLERPFDEDTLGEICRIVASVKPLELELHEARAFGRYILHDHPFFTQLQRHVVPLVSDVVGERVEPSYNFLSLYSARGVCPLHLDAPEAKWTLDLCIDQSAPWPIALSQVQPWPELEEAKWQAPDWEERIKASLEFTRFTLQPGQAVVFSGSSQWHYRDAIPPGAGPQGSTMLFLHFIPAGVADLVRPENWARLFGVPELERVGQRGSR